MLDATWKLALLVNKHEIQLSLLDRCSFPRSLRFSLCFAPLFSVTVLVLRLGAS